MKWAKIIDQRKCIGCHACTVACKSEHEVPLGVTRTFVKQVEMGVFPSVRRHFQVTRCNQCDNAPCVSACPTGAMYTRPDGIVDFNRDTCIGCKACIVSCPYDAIYIDPETHSAEKCNFCTHRIDIGLEPACVVVCPTQAIVVGDMTDPESYVSELISMEKTQVRKPEKGTVPKLFYVEGSDSTLDPLYASNQNGYLSAENRWRIPKNQEKQTRRHSGYPERSAAAAILAYQNETDAPWDWRVSLYSWTKSISAGVFMVAALGALISNLGRASLVWDLTTLAVSSFFLGLTGLLLVTHLSHPKRFLTILTRPQWRSWLTRGAFLMLLFTILLGLLFIVRLVDSPTTVKALRWIGIFSAAGVAVFTAFLLAQAKGRDMWQNPLLPVHFLVQAGLAGAAVLLLMATFFSSSEFEVQWLRWAFISASSLHLYLGLNDLLISHMTKEASMSVRNMAWGRWRIYYWGGIVATAGTLAIALMSTPASLPYVSVISLVGLLIYEHAYIQAGQSVPLS